MIRAPLLNFSKGEIAEELHSRVDVPAYNAALRKALNVSIMKYGGVQRRMGLRLAYEIREPEEGWDDPSSTARLVPFEYSIEQSYALLMTQAQMRPLAFGGAVLEDELAITGITSEIDAEITVAFHDYVVGDEIFPTGIEGELGALLNGRVWRVVEVVDANNFRIDADTSGLAAFTAAAGGTARTEAPDPPPAAPSVPSPYVPPAPPPVYDPGGWGDIDGREGRYLNPDFQTQ